MTTPPSLTSTLRRDNQRMKVKLLVVAVLMFGFGYVLVPLYEKICEALGVNVLTLSDLVSSGQGLPDASAVNTQVDPSRTITVIFDTNVRGPWHFEPARRSVQAHPGELVKVMYEFRNQQDRKMAAQAIPSYAPMLAGAHFQKLECFCFAEHKLAPGEARQWPVVFVIDHRLPRDVTTITLSYTFFEVPGRGLQAQSPPQEPNS